MLSPEVIGHPDCPILHRWTLIPWRQGRARKHDAGDVPWKLMVHHFLPHADDRDVHDHPRGFWTLVLRGGYDDMAQCPECGGTGEVVVTLGAAPGDPGSRPLTMNLGECDTCMDSGVVLRERMRPGMIRYRPATHAHRTKVHASGCWTIVVMGPIERAWGFWHGRSWVPWREYRERYGEAMRCE